MTKNIHHNILQNSNKTKSIDTVQIRLNYLWAQSSVLHFCDKKCFEEKL
jgi:hypothetical protein